MGIIKQIFFTTKFFCFTITTCVSLYPYLDLGISFDTEIYSTDVDIHQIILKYAHFVVEFSSIPSWEAQNFMNEETEKRTIFSMEE